MPPLATVVPTNVIVPPELLNVPFMVKSEEVEALFVTVKLSPEFTKVLPAATEQVPVAVV